MKYYLLIMGQHYYPGEGSGDWKQTFLTFEEAKESFKTVIHPYDANDISYLHLKSGLKYDWYEIVDLREWIN